MKILKRFVFLTLIILVSILLGSGLELTASTGSSDGSSSTHVVYGATVDDYANQHIQLNPEEGTLSNSFSGTGNLPSSSLSISDNNGNYASVYRSVSGKPKVTSWNYDWGTYYPYSSTAGYGVGAWLSLTANKAYSISGGSYSATGGVCMAEVGIDAGLFNKATTSSLKNYYADAVAFADEVRAYQSADYAKSTGPITGIDGDATNAEDGFVTACIDIPDGTISNPMAEAYSSRTNKWVNLAASEVSTKGLGNLGAYASSNEGTITDFDLDVTNGKIKNPNLYAQSEEDIAYTFIDIGSASGRSVDIQSHAQNTKFADEYLSYDDRIEDVPTYHGGADFEVKSKSLKYALVETIATPNGVQVNPVLPESIKTAIMLEPFRNSAASVGVTDLGGTVFPTLVKKGYATLRYTDSGASFDKYQNLGKYNVVVADGHGSSDGISLSTDPWFVPASQLNYQTSKKSLVVLTMCEGFAGYPSQKSDLASALDDAYLRGGFAYTVGTHWADDYISYFFDALSKGNTASKANTIAHKAVNREYGSDSISDHRVPLVFYGNQNFKL